ncbi:hypothetical protein JCM19992_31600 [Thermostilla marina]
MKTFAACLRMVAASAMIVSAIGNTPVAASEPVRDDASPSVWLVDSRESGCEGEQPTVYRVQKGGQVESVPTEEAYAALGDGRPIVVFIHGNLMERADALRATWALRDALLAEENNARPEIKPHFVAWCWPAGKVRCRVRKDAQIKALRSDGESCDVAGWLRIPARHSPVVLVGYSFGARTAGGTAKLLTGESYRGKRLAEDVLDAKRPESTFVEVAAADAEDAEVLPVVSLVWIAAGLSASWTAPGGEFDPDDLHAARLVITVNRQDPALRWYRRLWGCGGTDAMGYVGPSCIDADDTDVEVLDVTCEVGRTHDWCAYLKAAPVRAALRAILDELSP